MSGARVVDLSVEELRDLIREVVSQTIAEMLSDPDEGLELRDELRDSLQRSLALVQSGAETTPAESVAAKLGLKW